MRKFVGVHVAVNGCKRHGNSFNFAISSSFLSWLSVLPNTISTSSGVDVILLSRKDFTGEVSAMFASL